MKEEEELLQDRLERLETGESLEVCLAGLPGQEAALLRLASAMRQIRYPARDGDVVASQRADLLKRARERNAMIKTQRFPEAITSLWRSLLEWLRARPAARLAWVTAGVLVVVLVTIVGVVAGGWKSEAKRS